ncbi:MAG: hypothetical protein AAGC63_04630, partial [Propionicimonas sp.]
MSSSTGQSEYQGSTRQAVTWGLAAAAGFLLAMVGGFQILQGISALVHDELYLVGVRYVFQFDLTTWGWIHLILGLVAVATGIGLLFGQTWARILGIVIAILSSIANFAFLPVYP